MAVALLIGPMPKNSHGPPLEPRKHDEGTRVEKDVSLVIPSIRYGRNTVKGALSRQRVYGPGVY